MTWGGIRGGISIALALSLPSHRPERELILTVTYMVVIFSIVVQGSLLGKLVRKTVQPVRV
jgi:CPA1 family monovalent cation:H+ antiporter